MSIQKGILISGNINEENPAGFFQNSMNLSQSFGNTLPVMSTKPANHPIEFTFLEGKRLCRSLQRPYVLQIAFCSRLCDRRQHLCSEIIGNHLLRYRRGSIACMSRSASEVEHTPGRLLPENLSQLL